MRRFALLLLLAGCTGPDLARSTALNAAIGQSEGALVRELGTPSSVTILGDRRLLAYARRSAATGAFLPDPSKLPPVDAVGAAFGYPPEATIGGCMTIFTIRSDRVTGWSAHGDACG